MPLVHVEYITYDAFLDWRDSLSDTRDSKSWSIYERSNPPTVLPKNRVGEDIGKSTDRIKNYGI